MAENGNIAALREALEEQLRYWDAHIRTRDEEQMRQRTEAALAKPARNCDRFKPRTTDEVKAVIDEWRASARASERNSFYAFARWLFAKADKAEVKKELITEA